MKVTIYLDLEVKQSSMEVSWKLLLLFLFFGKILLEIDIKL